MSTQNHFGFQEVSDENKRTMVNKVFSQVAQKYDLMNDIMSFGIHRIWKTVAIELACIHPDFHILDLATGSGDLLFKMAPLLGENSRLVASDVNPDMLKIAQTRMLDNGWIKNIEYAIVDAEKIPFEQNSFDLVTIAFGLRNVALIDTALASIYKVLKPGGKILILEFSKPESTLLHNLYDVYSFHIIPKMGKLVAGDAESYQYLVESIKMFPAQKQLVEKLENAGFSATKYTNISGGIVAIHQGIK